MTKTKSGIVWLASYPRSGNTWTRNFLNNLFAVIEGRENEPKDINTLNEFTLWDIAAVHFEKQLGKKVKDANREAIAGARADVQKRIATEANGVALIKTHNALVIDRGHPTINFSVTAGAIYIVRNPLDVVISYAHHFGIEINQAINAMALNGCETDITENVVHEVYGSWSEHVSSWTRKQHPAILVMRYEDMLAQPEETFTALAQHLLIDASAEQISRTIEMASFERAKAQEKKKGYIERPEQSKAFFREGRAEQWREVLNEEQIARVVSDHREQMDRFGYIPDNA